MSAQFRIENRILYLEGEQSSVPDGEHWLSTREAAVLGGFKIPKRRQDWLLGRWTAKTALNLLARPQRIPMKNWEIEAGADGAPRAWLNGKPVDLCISLSHSSRVSLFAAANGSWRMGCDIEKIEARSRSFEETFFTSGELGFLEQFPAIERDRLVTLLWSARESVLKALRTGLRSDTRRIRIVPANSGSSRRWQEFKARDSHGGEFGGWWRESAGMVLTVAADHLAPEPIGLSQ